MVLVIYVVQCPMGIEDYRKDRNKRMEFHIFKHLVDDGIKRGLKLLIYQVVNEPNIRKDLPKFVKILWIFRYWIHILVQIYDSS